MVQTHCSARARRQEATCLTCRSGWVPIPVRLPPVLAARLGDEAWIAAAEVTGPGFLTVTVTHATLARLAVRIAQAGPACAPATRWPAAPYPRPPSSRWPPHPAGRRRGRPSPGR